MLCNGKNSKKADKEFTFFFKYFENVKTFGLPVSELGPAIMPRVPRTCQAFGNARIQVPVLVRIAVSIFVICVLAVGMTLSII